MSSNNNTKATCKCGASIETFYTSELVNWLSRHDVCLVQQSVHVPINYEEWQYNPMTGQKLWE